LQSGAMRDGEATTLTLLVGFAGAAVGLVFLFTVIGEYVDRTLAARGLGRSEE
ncbi:MAG: hypothetical protein GWN07_23145, partial [Actinobacteria bacterium]|nr:hypothetical protein [Actinomycetota bacterium]NIX22560.1 hypothetical protein [Actinomycetota bacterium]